MARDYKQLIVWQLAHELRGHVIRLARRPEFSQDWPFRAETRKTASQVCRPIPEGFRQRTHGEFARYLQYSLASVAELRDLFDEVEMRGYARASDLQPLRHLCYRLERALLGFIRYLRNSAPPPGWE